MNIRLLVLCLLLLITQFSCKRTCENVKVGETSLADNTAEFLLYNEGEEVIFVGSNEQVISFSTSTSDSQYFICQKVTCDPLDPYKSSYCEYIESPQKSIFLNSDSTLIAIEASVFAYQPETDLLFDAVRFTLSHQNISAFASHVTDVKFDSPSFDQSKIRDIDDFMEVRSEVTLKEKTYSDVLVCEDEQLTLYFTKTEGILGFRIEDVTYTLQD